MNHHAVPLAQYGHYWSSVGGVSTLPYCNSFKFPIGLSIHFLISQLLSEDQISETDSIPHQNGNGNGYV